MERNSSEAPPKGLHVWTETPRKLRKGAPCMDRNSVETPQKGSIMGRNSAETPPKVLHVRTETPRKLSKRAPLWEETPQKLRQRGSMYGQKLCGNSAKGLHVWTETPRKLRKRAPLWAETAQKLRKGVPHIDRTPQQFCQSGSAETPQNDSIYGQKLRRNSANGRFRSVPTVPQCVNAVVGRGAARRFSSVLTQ